jgi:mRNA interferase MazF
MIERYGIYWVNLDPVLGSEIAKRRPAVVISDDGMNRLLGTVVVCPITSRIHQRWPSRVQTRIGDREAEIAVDQIRTIDKARIGIKIETLDESAAAAVRHVVTSMYGVLSVE